MKEMKRVLSLVLCLLMLVSLVPATALTVFAATGETTYVLAGSDFQASSHDAGATIVSGLLDKIKVDYPTMDGFLFAGDYDVNYIDSANGKAKLQETVQSVYGTGMDEIYVQGNHDGDSLVGSTLTASGANDAENYGVFVINEKDYMWYNNDEATIKKTAENLESYLNAKRNAGFTKPIFVISHLPLHYSMRTRSGGNDGMHANYIFDVLNEAGNAGLNIIFLFGHDHSHGWDDYLGGAAIFLTKGDKINIAQNSTTVFEEETLAFTYMNAGYVGYYGTSYTSDVDKTLTMTTFAITDTDVTVSRYDSNGTHDLKSAGVYNVEYPDSAYYTTNTATVGTPYTMTLNTEITPAGEEVTPPTTGSDTEDERTYTRVTSTSELVSGGQYLLFYSGSHFMLPEVVEKSDGSIRKGFNIESTSICGPDTITGDYTAKEWTLTSSGSGWLLGSGGKYAKLTNTSDYKITATLEDSGDVFTIGGSANAFTFSNGTYVFNYNDRGLINGYASNAATFYIYRMTNAGSDTPTVDTEGGDWVTIEEPSEIQNVYHYTQVNTITAGNSYAIVGETSDHALMSTLAAQGTTVSGSEMTSTVELTQWTFDSATSGKIHAGNTYLRYVTGITTGSSSTGATFTITSKDNAFVLMTSNWRGDTYLACSNGNWQFDFSEATVRLFSYTETTTTGGTGLYGKLDGELSYTVSRGTSAVNARDVVMAGIDVLYHTGDADAAAVYPDDGEGMSWVVDPAYDGNTAGEYAVTISYNDVVLGVAKVIVPAVSVSGYSVEPPVGTVGKTASQSAQTGALIYVQLENGTFYTVPVTVDMLTTADGSAVSTAEIGAYENLTVTYNGVAVTDSFTLNVVAKTGSNYPEYPNEGAVKVGKTGTGIDFQSSGIAQVEISASGVPMKKGADVIVMLDLSSSMTNTVDGKTRLSVLEASLQSLMTQLKTNGDDGQPMDIRIAVADFNRYYTNSSSPYYISSKDTVNGGSIRTNTDGTNKVYTNISTANPYGKLDATAFVSVHDLEVDEFGGLSTKSGTNYDYAFDAVYQLGEAITAQNATDGVERDLFVIFMSDGAPFQYNYFSSQSGTSGGTTAARYWNNWLQGTMTDAMFASGSNKSYYNEDGKHWMAEAIKGDPAATYPVIRKNNAADTDGDNWVNVNGLGAKMYSIGFCLAVDKEITVASMDTVIRNIASDEQYYFRANTAADLNNAFTAIGGDIAYAAYNARYVDQMGDDYELQLKTRTYEVVDNGSTSEKTLAPVIEVLTYDIYTKAEADAGQIPTGKNIGDRKGTSTLKEVVKFSEDGKKAYSNLIDKDKDGVYGVTVNADGTYTITDADDNIFGENGVISATTFWYNTNSTAVEIEGVSIPTGKDSANLTTGSTKELPAETFYWKMGTVQTSEMALRYYVYLTGSMEGTREAGSYPTNEYATLYYDNYLHNPCYKETVSPVLAWKEANVSYAFYLVDENGNIIVNQTTGQTGTFANKIAVTNPVVYETVMLNSGEEVSSIDIASLGVLPAGYTLFDYDGDKTGATYTVQINSNTTGSWNITSVKDVPTTYVTQYDPNDASAYSNVLTNTTVGNDYTHTVVWFAVVWKIQALPDTVVIDYGLPVDISVLANDMFGENGELAGVGAAANLPADYDTAAAGDDAMASGFGPTYTGTYGAAKADDATGKVRYTLNTTNGMQMQTYEKFAYAVNYTGNQNAGFYYDTVTVIPATTIYYEDDFLTLTASGTEWKEEGTAVQDASQAEDRPGRYSLTDANNIYGYDQVNQNMSKFSLGTAQMVHVGPLADGSASYANAAFTFYGTGFDIISMTSNTTGVLAVKVTAAEDIYVDGTLAYAKGAKVKNTVVDTYYGYDYGLYEVTYTFTGGAWVRTVGDEITDENAKEEKNTAPENPAEGDTYINREYLWVCQPDVDKAMYQVPVLQANDLPYGKYDVTLIATYMAAMDDTTAEGYDLYLDAVRIYDPANDGAADNDTIIEEAYKADGEGWPSYIELRNKIIAANSFDNVANDKLTEDMEGLVFIDGDPSVGDAAITDYIGYGPNNEVYLAPGQSVAFLLSTPDNIANVHIGIKSADGNTAAYTITNIARNQILENNVVKAEAGAYYNPKTATISTTTDMYYDLTGWKGDIIVITNTGDLYNTTGVLSLTNIKSTYISAPTAGTATASEVQTYAVMTAAEETETAESAEAYIYMTPAAATLTLRSLNSAAEEEVPEEIVPEETEPETTIPEETEPETTVPEDTEPETTIPEETEPETTEPEQGSGGSGGFWGWVGKFLGWLFG